MNVLTLTSSFPRSEDSHEARWILELSKSLTCYGFIPLILAPHFPGGKIRESWNTVRVFRFVYFVPIRFERLAYREGLLFNVTRDFFAFIGVIPFFLSESLGTIYLLSRRDVRILHSHWLIPQGLVGAFVRRFSGIPHITSVHGSDVNLMKQYRILHLLGSFIIQNTDTVTVNSTYSKKVLESIFPESRRKIRVIPMGIDPEKFRGAGRENKIPDVEHRVLSVGRLIDWKGTIYLIKAMLGVLQQYPCTTLVIIGTGPEERNLRAMARELGIEDHIRFEGSVSQEELKENYQMADVFVLPSINIEGRTEALGVVLIEAMASGCPVIGSDVGGISDIITDNWNGFLVPERDPNAIAEKIIRILSDKELREQFRENGFRRVHENFSWETISRQFSKVYADVLALYSENND